MGVCRDRGVLIRTPKKSGIAFCGETFDFRAATAGGYRFRRFVRRPAPKSDEVA
jgi:hypothetical protein